jgi:hypothetical protein
MKPVKLRRGVFPTQVVCNCPALLPLGQVRMLSIILQWPGDPGPQIIVWWLAN